MHDLMREMALRITKVRTRFLVKAGMQLSEIPNVQEWNEDLEKVSLMNNWNLQIPSQMPPPKCPKLTTLLLSGCNIKSIPECFFEQMHGLKILDLSGNPKIKSLPNSISNLESLTTLLLSGCSNLEKVPSFSKLQALKKLDLEYTDIKDLPHGMEKLVNLKYLDLSGTPTTKIAEGISGLRKLEFFGGRFYDLNEWNSYVQALHAPINRYWISVDPKAGGFSTWQKKVIKLKRCKISCIDSLKVLSDVEQLEISECVVDLCEEEAFFSRFNLVPHNIFSSLSAIEILYCKNIKKLFSSNWVLQKNLQNLASFHLQGCKHMEAIIASESGSEEEGISAIKLNLPKLTSLTLAYLPELKSICSEVLVCDSIKYIEIVGCPKLKRIPLNLPFHDDGQPYPPPSLEKIVIDSLEQWELIEWDQPSAKSLLKPKVIEDTD